MGVNIMALMSWVDVRERCPIDISRLVSHANSFSALVGIRITLTNLNRAKKSLIDARGELDLVFVSLQQVLHDREILKKKTDEVLYGWLIDNIGRYLGGLDEKEDDFLIKYDEINSDIKRVGISRVSSYAKALKIAHSMIYESFLKSINEWSEIKEKDKKDKRAFLYIFFNVIQITMSSVGGLAREGKMPSSKKGQVSAVPSTWQTFSTSPEGQKSIADQYKKETGEEIPVDESMIEKGNKESSENQEPDEGYFEETSEEGEEYHE